MSLSTSSRMNKPLLYVMSAERSRKKSRKKSREKSWEKNLKARKTSRKENWAQNLYDTYWAPYKTTLASGSEETETAVLSTSLFCRSNFGIIIHFWESAHLPLP